ncbi:protein LTV1 homolog [Mercenaria mercenaria]|uniref:protein LTV1 homolog n=1 Tax=Mercenaria mercenaria TaxID=6596 RepID=UPI001E1DD2E0|nr:protein LTV1 homolog [Mercenaria mercenaria]
MPVRKKKQFIDKKNAITFHLVHRSQQDPLVASEDASKHVLVPGGDKDDDLRTEEQRKYGVFFDDDYDYMQHLKDTNEIYEVELVDRVYREEVKNVRDSGLKLPSSVLPSEYEKPVGLLNEAVPVRGPQPNWDPDIVEALDEDFDFDNPDNQLDDDFVQVANADGEDEHEGSDLETVSDLGSDVAQMSDNDDFDTDYKYGDHMFMDEETKSRFTNYSMSSSVIRRNEGLTLLDDRFEKLYEEYDDAEVGALDQEDIDGSIQQGSAVLDALMDEFEKTQKEKNLKEVVDEKEGESVDVFNEDSDTEMSDTDLVTVEVKPDEKWDCESILSTYSNLYNHPKLITEPKKVKNKEVQLKGKYGIPADVIATRGLTEHEINMQMTQRDRADKASTYRPKDETPQEKADRKRALKDERRERRQEKKLNRKAFTKEKLRQDKEVLNLNQNLKGVKIV